MQRKEIKDLVDKGLQLSMQIKALNDEFSEIKDSLKVIAENEDVKSFEGEKGIAQISAHSSSVISAMEFIKTCEEVGITPEGIASGLKVLVAKAKKILGEEQYLPIMTTNTNPYGVIKFKQK